MKLLIVRNDKLGDFMLAYPSFYLVKENLPGCEIHALVPEYTQAMAEACDAIDKVIIDPGKDAGLISIFSLLRKIKAENYDAVITLFSTSRIGLITFLAGIPYRLAPATKMAQLFYNHKLVQRRSRSLKPEYEYNLDLVRHYLKSAGINAIEETDAPYLKFPHNEILEKHHNFLNKYSIPASHKLVFIHAGSGGSANNLSTEQFSNLAIKIASQAECTIVLTAGPGEIETASLIANKLSNVPYVIFESTQGLIDFCQHIQFADIFIAGSTGPLHIAGALNTPTAGFYTRRKSATSLRWQTLNSDNKRLAFSPAENAEAEDMTAVDIGEAAKIISKKYLLAD